MRRLPLRPLHPRHRRARQRGRGPHANLRGRLIVPKVCGLREESLGVARPVLPANVERRATKISVVKSRFAVLQILPTPTPAAPHDLRRPLISALRSRSSLLKMSRSRRLHAACGLCRLTSHYYVSYEKKYLRDVTY